MHTVRRIIVGVHGSPGSLQALRFAGDEARQRHVPLLAVSAWVPRLETPGSRVVCTITGNGLKDPDWAVSAAPAPVTVQVDPAAAAAALGLA